MGSAQNRTFTATATSALINSADHRECRIEGDGKPLLEVAFVRPGQQSFAGFARDNQFLPIENGVGFYYELGSTVAMYFETKGMRLVVYAYFAPTPEAVDWTKSLFVQLTTRM
jgi:hypothetical protein